MDFDIYKIIDRLIEKKLLFVSERHLQVSFILVAKELYPKYEYIPEYVFKKDDDYHIDLIVTNGMEKIAFEFKYIVAGGVISVPGDSAYKLRNHSAIDIRRHQCVRDISRLETYKNERKFKCNKGFFLLITNMSRFWKGSKESSVAQQFDIKDNIILKKGVHVAVGSSRFTSEYTPIKLFNNYEVKYKDYLTSLDNKPFKYLCVKI